MSTESLVSGIKSLTKGPTNKFSLGGIISKPSGTTTKVRSAVPHKD